MPQSTSMLTALITDQAVIFGILMLVLAGLFHTAHSPRPFWKTFYKYVPVLLLAYFLPAILVSIGLIDGHDNDLYFVASRYLLPASLILLTLSIDFKGIVSLGPKALIMFLTATLGIVIGGPIALWLVSLMQPDVLLDLGENSIWRGLSTVAGSWIGGGANQAAMKEIFLAADDLFAAMIVVDVVVANIWMAFLLYGAGMSDRLDKKLKADNSAIETLKKSVSDYQSSIARVSTFKDLMILSGMVFGLVGLSHFLSGLIAPNIASTVEQALAIDPESGYRYITSLGSGFFWLIVFATAFGLILSFTRARTYEGAGASKVGSVFIYILVATIGMHMDLAEMAANWDEYKYLILIGLIWMLVHVIILLAVAKIIRAPFFFVAVGSQANVGGAASAPVVASAFSPSLAPVGVLLAVLGYALGTFAAIVCATAMQAVSL
jgi:uncharacterized membrane protein